MKETEAPDDIDLTVLGERIKRIDRTLVQLIAKRLEVVKLVGAFKTRHGDPIVRPDKEHERIEEAGKLAQELKLDPYMIKGIMHALINESCKRQLIQLEARKFGKQISPQENERDAVLKENLLELTKDWSEKYDDYSDKHIATRVYLEFEDTFIKGSVEAVEDRELFVDLGCATGRCLYKHKDSFDKLVGFDLCPYMLNKARAKLNAPSSGTAFIEHDLDSGIPLPNDCASMVVMKLGTASDIRNIKNLLVEIERVLKTRGGFMLSFYNSEALLYSGFFPWETGLAAQIDVHKHCLTVHDGDSYGEIYARAYQPEEVKLLVGAVPKIKIDKTSTYPTLAAVMHRDILEESAVQKHIAKIDIALSDGGAGAYILVSGHKE